MAQLHAQQHFRYGNVQISKTESLGIGSYGAVYKSRCGVLPCAAKILHPTLFQTNDPGATKLMQRFEQECEFLSDIRHPNIVQYLGTLRDNDTGLPVLLMELMDDNLTHFLEQTQDPLPYHVQVNLSHDIALALAYLHVNDLIHRDLSSNNVLLIAGNRAKVTDFGMSKLAEATPRMSSLTLCPGTMAYMPPEALKEPPVYSKKLDCFSHGIVTIQIVTRQFPNPGPAVQEVDYPASPVGKILMPVLDAVRRKSHIDLIDPTHPLLPLALSCLSYKEGERPSSENICHQLTALKVTPQYAESVRLRNNLEQQLQEKQLSLDAKEQQVHNLTQRLEVNEEIVASFQQLIVQREEMVAAKAEEIRELKEQLEKLDRARATGRPNVGTSLKLSWSECPSNSNYLSLGNRVPAIDGKTVYFIGDSEQVIAYDSEKKTWSELPKCPCENFALVIIRGKLTTVGGRQGIKPTNTLLSLSSGKWVEFFPPMPTKRHDVAAICTNESLIVAGGPNAVEVMNITTRQWSTASRLPICIFSSYITISEDAVYLMGGRIERANHRLVLTCSLATLLSSCHSQSVQTEVWQKVADIPVNQSACAVVKNHLVALGGNDSLDQSTTGVHMYDPHSDSWCLISNMPKRVGESHVAVLPGNRLMVVDCSGLAQIGTAMD